MSKSNVEPAGKAKGGIARAESLTKEQRSDIAKKAAAARWASKPLKATHKGNFKDYFGVNAECYILDDQTKTPVVTKTGLAKLLGIGDLARDIDRLLEAPYMKEHGDPELRAKMKKAFNFQYSGQSKNITNAHGYDITTIVDIGKALIDAREAKALPESRIASADTAQKIINASAKSGIRGLAYAVAGYEPEAQEVIEAFKVHVQEEARAWSKVFPDELYYEWYRLYGLNKPDKGGHPIAFRWFTERHIYKPLAKSKGVVFELAKQSRDEKGSRSDKIHQFLSEVGDKALRHHIGKVVGMASMSESSEQYESGLKRVFGEIE
ncbi:P63C domain-containing protein (plasmid) [Pantoea agglomerans]|uniref:P63C domain-containing protein n=1 Tax=Enterobacter agglomerans TaxID=549 RepID=UPI001F1CFE85|nr:P63C domain-containing protein [Pantoea agglomerans]UIL51504.1 P63C domain-containing protein [Pantoea agglomerans]UIL54747.1 P63C domain-containing protein [Pantoea agglomerans]